MSYIHDLFLGIYLLERCHDEKTISSLDRGRTTGSRIGFCHNLYTTQIPQCPPPVGGMSSASGYRALIG